MGVRPKNMTPTAKNDIFTKMDTGVIVITIQAEISQLKVTAVRVGSRHS
jgi:hypothetical protein